MSAHALQGTIWSAGNGPSRGWSPKTRLTVRNSLSLGIAFWVGSGFLPLLS